MHVDQAGVDALGRQVVRRLLRNAQAYSASDYRHVAPGPPHDALADFERLVGPEERAHLGAAQPEIDRPIVFEHSTRGLTGRRKITGNNDRDVRQGRHHGQIADALM